MRIDGDYTVYVLQGRSKQPEREEKQGWFGPSYDHFGHPPGFSASDLCWQKLGIHATFDYQQGLQALTLFNELHVEYDWRLMELKLSQHHKEVAMFAAREPGKESPHTNSYPELSDYEVGRRARAVHKGKMCQCKTPKLDCFYNCEKCKLPSREPVPGWREKQKR